MSWYVIQVATNMEDKVQEALSSTIAKKIVDYYANNMQQKALELKNAFGIDVQNNEYIEISEFLKINKILVPKEKIEEIKNGKKRETERKIFPGYLLVSMQYNDELGLLIRKTPKVAGFIGVAKDSMPLPIPQIEVDAILNQVASSKDNIKHKVEFEVGERVHIIDGPFVDFNAIIEEVLYSKMKLRVNVQIFGRETSVELDFGQVSKLI